mmetsp:Transcript_51251/g.148818  ORF Transcript_51251/g.148818 Transcript_51251/m.148818 type:complete len:244 (-) Transcript_51251:1299-2030(-)
MVPQQDLLRGDLWAPAAVVLVYVCLADALDVRQEDLGGSSAEAPCEPHCEWGSGKASPIQHSTTEVTILIAPKPCIVSLQVGVVRGNVVAVCILVRTAHVAEVRAHLQDFRLHSLQGLLIAHLRRRQLLAPVHEKVDLLVQGLPNDRPRRLQGLHRLRRPLVIGKPRRLIVCGVGSEYAIKATKLVPRTKLTHGIEKAKVKLQWVGQEVILALPQTWENLIGLKFFLLTTFGVWDRFSDDHVS